MKKKKKNMLLCKLAPAISVHVKNTLLLLLLLLFVIHVSYVSTQIPVEKLFS
jgi:hypothetical protein